MHSAQPNRAHDSHASLAELNNLHHEHRALLAQEPLALGVTVARMHGFDFRSVLICHNNTSACVERGLHLPFDIVPEPAPVAALCTYAVPCLTAREMALTLPLIPGYLEYLTGGGLLERRSQVVECNPLRSTLGFPDLDPVMLYRASPQRNDHTTGFIATFPSNLVKETMQGHGFEAVQQSDPLLTSNKAAFRSAAERYGFCVAPGMELHSEEDVKRALAQFSNAPRVWLKVAHGAGGDTVIPIKTPCSTAQVLEKIALIRGDVTRAFLHNQFASEGLEQYWPARSFAPHGSTLLLEADMSVLGTPLHGTTFSNAMLIDRTGNFHIIQNFRQITKDGSFIGSAPVSFDADITLALEQEMAKVARYCADELGLCGYVGVDFFVVQKKDGHHAIALVEMNGRPPNSLNALMVAQKAQLPYWVNCKLQLPEAVRSFAEFDSYVTRNGIAHAHASPADGVVIPTVFESLVRINDDGSRDVFHPSRTVRALVGSSRSQEHAESLAAEIMGGTEA